MTPISDNALLTGWVWKISAKAEATANIAKMMNNIRSIAVILSKPRTGR